MSNYFDNLINLTQDNLNRNFNLKSAISTRNIGFDKMLSYFSGRYDYVVTMNQVHGKNTCFIDDVYVDSKLSKHNSKLVETKNFVFKIK